jgi:ATP-binding cassette, subfamily C, bacterial
MLRLRRSSTRQVPRRSGRRMKSFVHFVIGELRWRLAAAAAVALSLAATEGAGLLLLVPLLASIGLTVDEGGTRGLAASASTLFQTLGLTPSLIAVLVVFLLVSTLHALLLRASLLLNPTLEQRLTLSLQQRLYSAIVRAEWAFFITRRSSDLVHALTSDIDRASAAAYQGLTLFSGLAISAVYLAISFWLSPGLTALVVLSGGSVFWALRGRSRHSTEMGERYREADRQHFRLASESVDAVKLTKSFSAQERGVLVFARSARVRADAYIALLRSFARSKIALDLATALLLCALIFVAVEAFAVRGAGLLLLVFSFARVMPRLMSLQGSAQIVRAGVPSFANVMRLVAEAEAQSEDLAPEASRLRTLPPTVGLDGVRYQYGGSAEQALDGISLSIPAGSLTAIVGASGAGKSTLADVLIGLLRPSDGRLLVDGRPLADADIAGWRRSIGYVPQESFLLHDSVRANLLWARPDATEPQMWTALERAAAADFLRQRAGGLDTVVGDRGVRLSGGERQRLALARALVTEPALLVLDEATSALDSVNEQQILTTVQQLQGQLTTVIITHRLSAIRGAGTIHVLDRGRLVESGTWAQLMVRGGPFERLLAAQHDEDLLSPSGRG